MDKQELNFILQEGEGLKLEFKESANTVATYSYLVRVEGIKENSMLSSSKVIKSPSKSLGDDFILSKLENSFNKDSGLSCEILNQIIENTSSFGNNSESVKWESLVTKILSSDFDIVANLPLENPLGAETTSKSSDLRNLYNSILTFSSSKNLTLGCSTKDDIIPTLGNLCNIMQSCFDLLFSKGSNKCIPNLFNRNPGFKQFKNLPDHYPGTFNSWSPTTNFTVSNNVFVNFNSHVINPDIKIFKTFEEVSDENH